MNARVVLASRKKCTWLSIVPVNERVAGIHGDVLNLHTEAFFESTHGVFSVPHNTAHHTTPHTQTHTTTHTTTHTHTPPTHGERRQREKREDEREKKKKKKKRGEGDKRREKRRRKRKKEKETCKRRDKTREELI